MPDLSIIVAAGDTRTSATRACLMALQPNASGAHTVVVVDAVDADTLAREFPQVRVIVVDTHMLTPDRWRVGIEAATTDYVALTIASCLPPPGWVIAIQHLLKTTTHAGIGGALDAPISGSAVAWAIYLARYSGYIPPVEAGFIMDIAGDNAVYRRAALEQVRESWRGGFWETLVHHALRARGGTLALDPTMTIHFVGDVPLGVMARQRFRHGRHYGATRGGDRLVRLITSPAIPVVLLTRIYRRVRAKRPDWLPKWWRALPALLVLIIAWSAGEIVGYATGKR